MKKAILTSIEDLVDKSYREVLRRKGVGHKQIMLRYDKLRMLVKEMYLQGYNDAFEDIERHAVSNKLQKRFEKIIKNKPDIILKF